MHDTSAIPRPRRRRLNDLRLRNRLILLVLIPLVASLGLASARVVTEADAIGAEQNLNGQVHIALSISRLVQAVQDERDRVALYLTDGQQPSDLTALKQAESNTDAAADTFNTLRIQQSSAVGVLPGSVQDLATEAIARLNDLPTLRASVSSLGDNRPIFQAYTTIVSELLNYSGQLATNTTDRQLGALVNTMTLLEQAGEETSQERGYAVSILGNGGELLEQQEALIQAQAQYTSAYDAFEAQAPADIVGAYDASVAGDMIGAADSTVQQTIDTALENHPVASVGVSAPTAFAQLSEKLTQIRAIEQRVGGQTLARTSALLSQAQEQLYLNAAIIIVVLALAVTGTIVIARSIVEPLRVLRNGAYEIATVRLPAVIRRLRDTNAVIDDTAVAPIGVSSADEIGAVARAFDEVHAAAVRLASEQALLRNNVNAIFTNLSRRSQTLVERQLTLIDALENSERDPEQLAQLFRLDHLATRMRRNNENLLVLSGEETARRWTEAVRLVDVARAAAAEVEQYERIVLGEVPRAFIVGKAAPDIAHLVAELLENATAFSSPQTKVWIAAYQAQDGGVIIRIEDVGIGMRQQELDEANERIANPPVVDVSVARRMGLFVVGRLAARYSIQVRLSAAQAGGISATIHIPVALLASGTEDRPRQSLVDQEFYALSRQLTQNSYQTALEDGAVGYPAPGAHRAPRTMPRNARPPSDPRGPRFPAGVPSYGGVGAMAGFSGLQPPEEDEPADESWFQFSPEERRIARAGGDPAKAGPRPQGGAQDPRGPLPQREPRRGAPIPPQRPNINYGRAGDPAPAAAPAPSPSPSPGGTYPAGPQRPASRTGTDPETWSATLPPERLPIFDAVESEWFRQHNVPDPHAAAPGAAAAPPNPAQARPTQARPVPANPAPAHPVRDEPRPRDFPPPPEPAANPGGPAAQGGFAAAGGFAAPAGPVLRDPTSTGSIPTVNPAAAPPAAPGDDTPGPRWSSPADEGWAAARNLADPARQGTTTSGLPKRAPRANLVPGSAGGSGAAPAAVPPSLARSADAVGRRLDMFRGEQEQRGGDSR